MSVGDEVRKNMEKLALGCDQVGRMDDFEAQKAVVRRVVQGRPAPTGGKGGC